MSDDAEEIYEVEALLDHRLSVKTKKTVQYLIKWKNYDESNNTWEEEKNIFSKELLEKYWKAQPESREAFLAAAKGRRDKASITKSNPRRSTQRSQSSSTSSTSTISASTKKAIADSLKSNSKPILVDLDPPNKMTWNDVKTITNVYKTPDGKLVAEVQWADGQRTTCQTQTLRKECPDQLIEFYEDHLQFE